VALFDVNYHMMAVMMIQHSKVSDDDFFVLNQYVEMNVFEYTMNKVQNSIV
jgi:hypothetical protein